jgi:hypothetical protein
MVLLSRAKSLLGIPVLKTWLTERKPFRSPQMGVKSRTIAISKPTTAATIEDTELTGIEFPKGTPVFLLTRPATLDTITIRMQRFSGQSDGRIGTRAVVTDTAIRSSDSTMARTATFWSGVRISRRA